MIVRLPQIGLLRPALLLLPLFAAAGLAGCSEDNGPGSTTPGISLTVLDVNTPLDITPDGSLALLV